MCPFADGTGWSGCGKGRGVFFMNLFFMFGELGIIHKKKRSFCNFTALNNGNGKFIIKKTI